MNFRQAILLAKVNRLATQIHALQITALTHGNAIAMCKGYFDILLHQNRVFYLNLKIFSIQSSHCISHFHAQAG